MAAIRPNRCTGTTARTRSPASLARAVAAATVRALAQSVSGSTSQNTGRAPAAAMASAAATNEKAGVTTASPAPTPSARSDSSIASVPDATPTACSTPHACASQRSNSSTGAPRMNFAAAPSLAIAATTSSFTAACCAARSLSGTFTSDPQVHLRWSSDGSDVRTLSWYSKSRFATAKPSPSVHCATTSPHGSTMSDLP